MIWGQSRIAIGRILHVKIESRNLKFDCASRFGDFDFEVQDSSDSIRLCPQINMPYCEVSNSHVLL